MLISDFLIGQNLSLYYLPDKVSVPLRKLKIPEATYMDGYLIKTVFSLIYTSSGTLVPTVIDVSVIFLSS